MLDRDEQGRPLVKWTPELLHQFRVRYDQAVAAGDDTLKFTVEGEELEFVTGYAK